MNLIRKKEIEIVYVKKIEYMNNVLLLLVNFGCYYCFFIFYEIGKFVFFFIFSV